MSGAEADSTHPEEKPTFAKGKFAPWSDERLREKVLGGVSYHPAYFDARVFSCPSNEVAMLAVFWRHSDAYRNAISNLAMCHFSSKQLFKKDTQTKIAMLAEKGIKPEDYPPSMLYGTFIKREQYDMVGYDPRPPKEEDEEDVRDGKEDEKEEGKEEGKKDGKEEGKKEEGKEVVVKRTRPCAKSFKWTGSKEKPTELVFRKFW